ncbi:MAG: type I-E CRISPR-associated protein Cas7/Cse4/CasC, partial [Chloroflexi bacterium]|nr:type I-E CRISPR-associated protein Cas7/Cse4/CasC [Chloroflexota bacterium]
EMGLRWVYEPLCAAGVDKALAEEAAQKVAEVFGKQEDDDEKLIKQLAHVSPEERAAIDALVQTVLAERRAPTDDELHLLRHDQRAADIALFGRMLADKPDFNVEAAAQVAHAITVHPVAIEDDYFTAVDDLNDRREDMGAGHVGETEFGAGVFYLYVCIDRDRLAANLQGDDGLVQRTVRALAEAVCTIAPAGKQNSFASRAYASYALAERGGRQPRSLAVAFLDGVRDGDYVRGAIAALEGQVEAFDAVYGPLARERRSFNVAARQGTLADILDFLGQPAGGAS